LELEYVAYQLSIRPIHDLDTVGVRIIDQGEGTLELSVGEAGARALPDEVHISHHAAAAAPSGGLANRTELRAEQVRLRVKHSALKCQHGNQCCDGFLHIHIFSFTLLFFRFYGFLLCCSHYPFSPLPNHGGGEGIRGFNFPETRLGRMTKITLRCSTQKSRILL
jgi:hypothetical protein